jgi:hypothetical protein
MSNSTLPTSSAAERMHSGARTVFSIAVFGLFLLIVVCAVLGEKLIFQQAQVEADVVSDESKEERKRKRKVQISNGLIVYEWVPDEPPVESTEGDHQDTPSPGEAVEAPQPPAPPINSSPASCVMGSDDCESIAGEDDEMAGCAICLSHFKPQQLVCKSNNSLCQHVFHKDCMVDWLMKRHDNCPMCREVYVLKAV